MTSSASLRVEEIYGDSVFELAAEWNHLATAMGTFFQSETWGRNWWEHLAKRAPIKSLVLYEGGSMAGIASLVEQDLALHRRLPIRAKALVPVGSLWGGADHMNPLTTLSSAAAREQVVTWLSTPRPLTVMLPGIDPSSPVGGQLTVRMAGVSRESCPRTVIPANMGFEDLAAGWTRNRRKKLGQLERRFQAAGGSFEWHDDARTVRSLLPIVRELHRARMTELGMRTKFGWSQDYRNFHFGIINDAKTDLGPWIQIAQLDGAIVAALYGFRAGGTYHVYQSGWIPEAASFSPGLLQYYSALKHVAMSGGAVFDMCRGLDAYKLRFATDVLEELTLIRPVGVLGRLLKLRWSAKTLLESGFALSD